MENSHPIFATDPSELMKHVYKQVWVKTVDDKDHVGWVYTVDPVSNTLCLVTFTSDRPFMEMVMGNAVKKLTVVNDDTEMQKDKLDKLFRHDSVDELGPEELKERKETVRLWLLKHRLPVEVSSENPEALCISNALSIEPPYTPSSCMSTNEIILGKIQGLLKNMPLDVKDWD
ncbi:gem-associated protein 6-like [Lineus longissimus]|uniref:gem-associated protein 6-like n=1 Tax=Lineus longissimus TaxID=88925 RepID=UPI00315D946D